MLRRILKQFSKEETSSPTTFEANELLQVTADSSRCCQCGICGYNCPVGIEVREYARRGENVTDSRCINCGACIEKCPRATLRWGPVVLIRADNTLEINPNSLPLDLQLKSDGLE